MNESIKEISKLLLGGKDGPSQSSYKGEVYCFFVGVDKYKKASDLDFSKSDSEMIKRLIIDHTKKKLKPKNVFELFDEQATKINIIENLKKLNEVVSKKDILIVMFSGHSLNYKESVLRD